MGCGPSTESDVASEQEDDDSVKWAKTSNRNARNIHSEDPVNVNEIALLDYLQIERDIAEAEVKNPLKPLNLKTEQLLQLTEHVAQLEIKVKDLEREMLQEKSDVEKLLNPDDEIKTTIMNLGSDFDEQMAKEKAEYIAALNRQEMAAKELQLAKRQTKQVERDVEDLEKQAQSLQTLFKRQDDILAKIFGGQYGSLLENQLETELDYLEAQRGRILEANFKWRQGLMMLEYACKQLAVAVQKWQDLPSIPTLDLEIRYNLAAETRNNIVAAGQNISGAQRYLDNVDFPYCKPGEVDTLNKAAQYIFTDMQSPDRQEHANDCYETTHKRANALLQWFDTVINTTIMKDLHEINEKVKEKTLELRRERVKLMKDKIREMYGTEVQLDQTLRGRDISAKEIAMAMLSDNEAVKIDDLEVESSGISPLISNDDLAPIPSNSVIFGSMYDNYDKQLEDLRMQHQEELASFLKEQETNEKKIKGSLQEKLMIRRQRRARTKLENAQQEAFERRNRSNSKPG